MIRAAVLSIIIPTLNAADSLPATLEAVGEATRASFPCEIVVSDGGSQDATRELAVRFGARVINSAPGRGRQLAAGAGAAGGEWLLFLHADTRLSAGWSTVARDFMARSDSRERAGYFRLVFDDPSLAARVIAQGAMWRARWLGLPYGDQALLMSRAFHDALGGFRALPLMEDVDLVRRIGKRRLVELPAEAHTSAARYRRDGWLARPARNVCCVVLYFLGVDVARIARLYR